MADKNKPLESTEPKALVIHDVVVPKGTYCDRCKQQTETGGTCEECEMELRGNL